MDAKHATVDEYIASFPPKVQRTLKRVRQAIRKAVPEAEEGIGYQMPAYKYHGRLIYFAAWANHYALYPGNATLVEEFAPDLVGYTLSKGTIQFSYDAPIPVDLITRIAQHRAAENLAKAEAKRRK
ncbi:MAG: DUF1801 domain-containing protein [Dehalococcoidia bacterium]